MFFRDDCYSFSYRPCRSFISFLSHSVSHSYHLSNCSIQGDRHRLILQPLYASPHIAGFFFHNLTLFPTPSCGTFVMSQLPTSTSSSSTSTLTICLHNYHPCHLFSHYTTPFFFFLLLPSYFPLLHLHMYHAQPYTTYLPKKKKYHTPPLFLFSLRSPKNARMSLCALFLPTFFPFLVIDVAVSNSPSFTLPILFFPPIASSRTATTTIKHKIYPLPHTSSCTRSGELHSSVSPSVGAGCMFTLTRCCNCCRRCLLFFSLFCFASPPTDGRADTTPFVAIYQFAQWFDSKENIDFLFAFFFSSTAKPNTPHPH